MNSAPAERSFSTWLSRKVVRAPVRGLERLSCGRCVASGQGLGRVRRPRGAWRAPGGRSGRCDGQLVGVELQQVVRGGDQSPF